MHNAAHIVPLFHYADQISSQLRNLRKHNFLQLIVYHTIAINYKRDTSTSASGY